MPDRPAWLPQADPVPAALAAAHFGPETVIAIGLPSLVMPPPARAGSGSTT